MEVTQKASEFDSKPIAPRGVLEGPLSEIKVNVRGPGFLSDIDLAAITQAGGWKSTRMPLQYAEKINAARSGMARAAAATGRDTRGDQPGKGAER
jgi:hypothetical protein